MSSLLAKHGLDKDDADNQPEQEVGPIVYMDWRNVGMTDVRHTACVVALPSVLAG